MPCALKEGEEISRLETTCICKGESVPPVEKESIQGISVPKDSLVEEPPDSFVSDNVPVVPRDGITLSSEDSLVKEPPDTVVCVVQSCVVSPRVGVTPSRGILSDVSRRQRKTTDGWDPGPRVQRAIPVLGA